MKDTLTALKPQEAIEALLREDTIECYTETLDELWEAWLCSNYADGTTGDERSLKLTHTKALKRFLQAI